MAQLAAECGVSKALLYHYYTSKEALLFDIIESHLEDLVEAVSNADDKSRGADARLEALVAALLAAYRDADAEHRVQVEALRLLPGEFQEKLKALERELVATFSEAICALNPQAFTDKRLLKPVTMSLFGTLNWFYMWFREDGPISRADYAKLAARMFISGVRSLEQVE